MTSWSGSMQVYAPFFKHANSLLSQKCLPRLARLYQNRQAVPIAAFRSFRIDFREKQSELQALFQAELVFQTVDLVVRNWWNLAEPMADRQDRQIWRRIAECNVSICEQILFEGNLSHLKLFQGNGEELIKITSTASTSSCTRRSKPIKPSSPNSRPMYYIYLLVLTHLS